MGDAHPHTGVSISLDGTAIMDHYKNGVWKLERTPRVVGNYNNAPFPSNTFSSAHGSCSLEQTMDFDELFRVLKPGAKALLGSCEEPWILPETLKRRIVKAGFTIIKEDPGTDTDTQYFITIRKPTHS